MKEYSRSDYGMTLAYLFTYQIGVLTLEVEYEAVHTVMRCIINQFVQLSLYDEFGLYL